MPSGLLDQYKYIRGNGASSGLYLYYGSSGSQYIQMANGTQYLIANYQYYTASTVYGLRIQSLVAQQADVYLEEPKS